MSTVLYGDLVDHPWRDPHVDESDPYSLFVSRSSALGWLDDPGASAAGGLWGMNDAGRGNGRGEARSASLGPDGGPDTRPPAIAWFQVGLVWPFPAGRPLPVQPFLACAGDVVSRIGTPRVDAVRLLLPVGVLRACRGAPTGRDITPRDGLRSLLQDARWFVDLGPDARREIDVTFDAGAADDVRPAAPGMRRWLREIQQDVFVCEAVTVGSEDPPVGAPRAGWPEPSPNRVAFRGTLSEWSLDAVGWLAAYLAEAAYHHGVATPGTLTVRLPGCPRGPG
ncbi:MAG: hypothetical protein DIU79_07365 [Actinobacteria bacterium]|nr:MAG: hypothetical protein DIU79_07365 [Actinomycetota bacterium]